METVYDVVIIGGGSMGIAAAYYLAKKGQRVVVVDQFTIPNLYGSHHGETRILRLGYGNGGTYVPLVKEALALWRALEKETGKTLYNPTGAISVGYPESKFVKETIDSSIQYDLAYEALTADEVMARWPGITVPADYVACYDPDSGFLYSEECVRTYKEQCQKLGVAIVENQRVEGLDMQEEQVTVQLANGVVTAKKAIVTAGAWLPKVLPDIDLAVQPLRKTFGWFQTEPELYSKDFPCYVFDTHDVGHYYGFPDYNGQGLKIGRMDLGDAINPDELNRDFYSTPKEEADLRAFLSRYMPEANGELNAGKVCMFSMTPDEDFIVDFHPTNQNVILAGGFSGHGFKFASAIGNVLAELATDGKSKQDISFLSLSRFEKAGAGK